MSSLKKYLRVSKSPEEKEIHLKKLADVLDSPHWREVQEEMEDTLIRSYESFEQCNTYEEFMAVQGEVKALKKLANLNGLAKTVAFRRQRLRSTE